MTRVVNLYHNTHTHSAAEQHFRLYQIQAATNRFQTFQTNKSIRKQSIY